MRGRIVRPMIVMVREEYFFSLVLLWIVWDDLFLLSLSFCAN